MAFTFRRAALPPVRDDKKGEDAIIKGLAFSDHYEPIQNETAFSVLGDMADVADIDFVNVGSWGNGAGVYAQISLGDMIDVGSTGDKVGKYISLVNSHDGSRALSLLVTPFRFFCQNQISKAINDATKNNRLISIHHNIYGQRRLAELAEAVQLANNIFDTSAENYKRLADRVITMSEAREAIYRSIPYIDLMTDPKETERTHNNYLKKLQATIDRFNDADGGKMEKMTGWNLYNAIQGAYQHGIKKTATYEKSLIMGPIAQQAEDALENVNDILFNGKFKKTSSKEFDKMFAKVA